MNDPAPAMEPTHLWAFLWEVRKQSEFAAGAYKAIEEAADAAGLWPNIQLFVGAAANLSKLLWGSHPDVEARRAPLRAELSMAEGSPLRDRVVRNSLEHVDERIDDWWEGAKGSGSRSILNYIDAPYLVIRATLPDLQREELFRHFDRETGTLRFWDAELALRPVAVEIDRLRLAAKAAIQRYEASA
ncbi:hypothetical protein BH23CHL8_BH23CHL8_30020 [soil metagenome]